MTFQQIPGGGGLILTHLQFYYQEGFILTKLKTNHTYIVSVSDTGSGHVKSKLNLQPQWFEYVINYSVSGMYYRKCKVTIFQMYLIEKKTWKGFKGNWSVS